MKLQEFSDGPDMLCDPSGHCRCSPPTDRRQTCMRGAMTPSLPPTVVTHIMILHANSDIPQTLLTMKSRGHPLEGSCQEGTRSLPQVLALLLRMGGWGQVLGGWGQVLHYHGSLPYGTLGPAAHACRLADRV